MHGGNEEDQDGNAGEKNMCGCLGMLWSIRYTVTSYITNDKGFGGQLTPRVVLPGRIVFHIQQSTNNKRVVQN